MRAVYIIYTSLMLDRPTRPIWREARSKLSEFALCRLDALNPAVLETAPSTSCAGQFSLPAHCLDVVKNIQNAFCTSCAEILQMLPAYSSEASAIVRRHSGNRNKVFV